MTDITRKLELLASRSPIETVILELGSDWLWEDICAEALAEIKRLRCEVECHHAEVARRYKDRRCWPGHSYITAN